MELPMSIFESGQEFWDYTREFIAPFRRILDQIPEDAVKKIEKEVVEAAPQGNPDGKVSLNGNPILGSATK